VIEGGEGSREPAPGTPAREAIPALLDIYGERLLQLGLRTCHSQAEAEDLLQETMVEALRSWEGFEGRSRPSTWLFRIALRTCRRMHRRRAGEPPGFDPLDRLQDASRGLSAGPRGRTPRAVARAETTREVRRRLDAALAIVPRDFRIALVLKDIADFSLEEVAEILGVRPATVKTRVHRGRLKLREALSNEGVFGPLPESPVPRRVCMDLLRAKLDAMDRGVDFPFPHGEICDRCSALFQSLDLGQQACASLRGGDLPEVLRIRLEGLLSDGSEF
jgi:RNA polymerase sigma-70 factor (ECF subfamily)